MATLVLSTVGSALGGPVGGAIGALVGQSIDQQLLGASPGRRLGDLSVQTSSYGTQVPRIYGRMRVAGSVIWATDLVENSAQGAKGQPDTYGYSVSFAVAVSSRPIAGIGRIWADGKLIRDADGVFTVETSFRVHDGNEDQPVDFLIGSAEGIANVPAYRGLAYALFEDLDLSGFGNRIPFLTLEVIADEMPPAIGAILSDAASGAVVCDAVERVDGYAAYGGSLKSAIEPLVECFAIELFDDGSVLRSPTGAALAVGETEFGVGSEGEPREKLHREQLPAAALPSALRLSYYDAARDFQAGEARASAGEQSGNEEQLDLPAVVDAATAKSLGQQILARRWAARDRLTLHLPPRYLSLLPGSRLALPLAPANWIVERCNVDCFVVVVELRPSWKPTMTLAADGGRVAPNISVGPAGVSLALFDVPQPFDQSSTRLTLLLAASSPSPGWKSTGVEIEAPSQTFATRTAVRKTILGRALNELGTGEPYLIDDVASVDVELVDAEQWLLSCDDDALVNGANLAIVGSELIQFGEVVPIGPGQFRLRHLLRGRLGTEWAAGVHAPGEQFALVTSDALRLVELPDWATGSEVTAAAAGSGGAIAAALIASGESLRPPSPVRIETEFTGAGDLSLSWIRRSRRGWAWVDEIDAPLGESREAYRVNIAGTLGAMELDAERPGAIVSASKLADVGAGEVSIEVRQLGDWGVSRPAQRTITIA